MAASRLGNPPQTPSSSIGAAAERCQWTMNCVPQLQAVSTTHEGRLELVASGKLEAVASWLSQSLQTARRTVNDHQGAGMCQQQLGALTVLRNACALGSAAAAVLLQHDLPRVLAQAAAAAAQALTQQQQQQNATAEAAAQAAHANHQRHPPHPQPQQQGQQLSCQAATPIWLLRAVQLLHNISATGTDGSAAVWSALFPDSLSAMLLAANGSLHEVLALTMLSCTRSSSSSQALQDLTSPAAHNIWCRLLAPLMPHTDDDQQGQQQQAEPAGTRSPATSSTQSSIGTSDQQEPQAAGAAAAAAAAGGQRQAPGATPVTGSSNDNVCLLVKSVAMQHNRLEALMQLLAAPLAAQPNPLASPPAGGEPSSATPTSHMEPIRFTGQQAVLLHIVAVEAAAVPAALPLPGAQLTNGADPAAGTAASTQQQADSKQAEAAAAASCSDSSKPKHDWLLYAVNLLKAVWAQATASAPPTAGVSNTPTVAAHVLEATLQVLKAALARDGDTAGGGAAAAGTKADTAVAAELAGIAQHLHTRGLTQQLLQMLTALGPPPKTKQEQQRQLEQQQQQQQPPPQQQQQQQQPPPQQQQPPPQQQQQPPQQQPPQQQQQQQHQQPYAGYRADLVAVLSNLLLGGHSVQEAVMSAGGIELLLSSCSLDESSPMAREWALWGIRNACEGSEAVQAYVAQFRAVDAVQSPELDRAGLQLELDQLTHKLQLSKKPGGQQ